MKKITQKLFILLFCIVFFASKTTATNFYVDPVSGLDTNDGLSWGTAVKTIPKATTLANTSPYNTTVDDILIKGGSDIAYTINFASGVSTSTFGTTDNYYGSCKGDETSPSQRPLTDRDGNGITEPWEFQYPTTLSSTYSAGTAFTIATPYQFNGFTLTHTGTSTTTAIAKTVVISSNLGVFANNIITGCILNVSGTGSTNIYSILLKALGRVQNCLIEKNQISVSFTANISCFPIMEVAASGSTGIGTKILNCIVRNNKVTLDYTGCTATTANSSAKGLMMNITAGTSAMGYTVANNCLIHNNEMSYIPNATYSPVALTVGAPLYIAGVASATDSIVNCTVANNKGTKIYYAGINISNTTGSNFILNNVFWNNQNDPGTGAVASNIYSNTPSGTNLISNNFSNSGSSLTNNGTTILNNDKTMDAAINVPNFRKPTITIGNTTDNSTELSDWSLTSGSYLIGKGTAISATNSYYNSDKAGNLFATSRSVGAYELQYYTTTLTFNNLGTVDSYTNGQILTNAAGTQSSYNITANSGYKITSALYNGTQIKDNIVGGIYTAPAQFSNSTFVVQFDLGTAIQNTGLNTELKPFSVLKSGILSNQDGTVQIFSVIGKIITSLHVNSGSFISMQPGIYVICFNNGKEKTIQKIVL